MNSCHSWTSCVPWGLWPESVIILFLNFWDWLLPWPWHFIESTYVDEWVFTEKSSGQLYQWEASFNIVIYEVFAYWEPQNSNPIRVGTGQKVRGQLELAHLLLMYLSRFFSTSLPDGSASKTKFYTWIESQKPHQITKLQKPNLRT